MVRVGIDASFGRWNAPVDADTGAFIYVPIPESQKNRPQMARHYREVKPCLAEFGTPLPAHLSRTRMHLDPDFDFLSYGDMSRKGKRIAQLCEDDLIAFYAGLRDKHSGDLVYALIGLYVVDHIQAATALTSEQQAKNAHSRCVLSTDADDIVVWAKPKLSGRLQQAIPIGSRRAARSKPSGTPVYRVLPELLEAWGDLSNNDGYLQRSAVPPEFNDAERFYRWFQAQSPTLLASNGWDLAA
jgi:hypothetical protein